MIEDLHTISSTHTDIQSFSHAVGGVLLLIGFLSFLFDGEQSAYFFVTGGVLLFLGVLAPRVLWPVHYAWMSIATIMGWIMMRVLLGALFYLIVTPIGLVRRRLGKQFFITHWDPDVSSYWVYRKAKPKQKESYTVQF